MSVSKNIQFNFVVPLVDENLLREVTDKSIENMPQITTNGTVNWCLQTYDVLKRRGNLNVSCETSVRKNAVNISHSADVVNDLSKVDEFIVCIQADYPPRIWSHAHIVQNRLLEKTNYHYMIHWSQPGLIPRDYRRNRVSNIAYAGQVQGNFAGGPQVWETASARKGFVFRTMTDGNWYDYSSVDILVAIRSFNKQSYPRKPPTKLLNAWIAGIPMIGGSDSAFKQVGVAGEDYLLAHSLEETLEWACHLRENPRLYAKLVENGRRKANLYCRDNIARWWEDLLLGPIAVRYHQFLQRKRYEKLRWHSLRFVGLTHHNTKRLVKKVLQTN